MTSTASVGGLISGMDTNSILDKLYQISQAPINRLQARQDQLRTQSTAWSQLDARLLSFRTAAQSLASAQGFRLRTASVSREDLAAVTTSAEAQPGSYSFTVEKLASSHQVVSQGFADVDQTEVGSGTVSIKVGSDEAMVIPVDRFTLAELRDAINASDAGVSASIINDGSGADPYRLIVTSKTGGTAGSMDIEFALTGGTPVTLTDLQVAQDAQLKLGSGPGAVVVTSSTNRIQNVLPGVTIDLLNAEPGAPVSLTVSADTAAIQGRITAFVDAYNVITSFLDEQFHYDAETGQSGTLFADYRLEELQRTLTSAVTGQVTGLTQGARALADVGVRTLSDGTLSVDSAALAAALANEPEGVVSLFAATGLSSSPAVSYLTASADTAPSGAAGWEIEITQAASRARVTAGVMQAGVLSGAETLTIRGVEIALGVGMTQAEVVAAINARQKDTGVIAGATGPDGSGSGGYLTLTAAAYGSPFHVNAVSSVSNQAGSTSGVGSIAVADDTPTGEGGLGTGAVGNDVQGTIGGAAATGSGQRLTGAAGAAEGLSLLVTASTPGSHGRVTFTVGAAESAVRATASATDDLTGTIAAAQTHINDLIANMDEEIGRLKAVADQANERMKAAFSRMESALGRYQAQSQYLAGQLGQIQQNASSGSTK